MEGKIGKKYHFLVDFFLIFQRKRKKRSISRGFFLTMTNVVTRDNDILNLSFDFIEYRDLRLTRFVE